MPLIKSFRPIRNIYFRSVLFGSDQYLSSQTKIIKIKCFIWDESDSTIGNLSSDYDIKYSIFGNHKIYETIYFRFHFIIMQDKKNLSVNRMVPIFGHAP
jgi:hypothetical protein